MTVKRRIFLISLAALLIASCNIQVVQAFDREFYSGNGIEFYDPNACSAEAEANLEGNDNLEKILRYFTGKGLSLVQAAGIAGNMQQESGMDPRKIQGGGRADDNYKLAGGIGFGLVQWTSRGRQIGISKFAVETDRKITDLGMQLDYVWKELEGPYDHTLKALKDATNPVDAAIIVHGPPTPGYEASSDSPDFVRRVRGGNAKRFYEQFKDTIADNTGTTAVGCSGSSLDFLSDNFVVYDQYDSRWANNTFGTGPGATSIGAGGCGPSAMAMIVTALTRKSITPKDTVAFANTQPGLYIPGTGSSWGIAPAIAKHWGLKAKKITNSVAAVNEVFRSGGLVVTSGTGASPFTSGGHYIMIRGVTADGKWKIGDSNGKAGKENSKKEWDPQFILDIANTENVVAITK